MTYESEPLEFVIRHFFHNKTCDYNKCDSHFNKSVFEGYISSRTNRIFWPLLVHRMSNSKLLLSESANVKLQLCSTPNKKIVHNDVISCTSMSKASCLVRRWSRTTRCFTSSELKSKSTNQISVWVKKINGILKVQKHFGKEFKAAWKLHDIYELYYWLKMSLLQFSDCKLYYWEKRYLECPRSARPWAHSAAVKSMSADH